MAEHRFASFASQDPDPSKNAALAFWEQRVYFDGVPRRRREIVATLSHTPGMTERAAQALLASAEVADGTAPIAPPWVVEFEGKGDLDPDGRWRTVSGNKIHITKDGEIDAGGNPTLRKILTEKAGLKIKGEGAKSGGSAADKDRAARGVPSAAAEKDFDARYAQAEKLHAELKEKGSLRLQAPDGKTFTLKYTPKEVHGVAGYQIVPDEAGKKSSRNMIMGTTKVNNFLTGMKKIDGETGESSASPQSGIEKIMADIKKNPPEKGKLTADQKANAAPPENVFDKGKQLKHYGEVVDLGLKHSELNNSLQRNNHIASSLMNGDIDGLRRHFGDSGKTATQQDLVRSAVESLMDESTYSAQKYAMQFNPKLEHASGQTLRNGLMNIANDRMAENASAATAMTPAAKSEKPETSAGDGEFKPGKLPTVSIRNVINAIKKDTPDHSRGGRYDMLAHAATTGIISNRRFLAVLPPSGKDRDAIIKASGEQNAANGGKPVGKPLPYQDVIDRMAKNASSEPASIVGHRSGDGKKGMSKTLIRDAKGNTAVVDPKELAPVLKLWPKSTLHVSTQKRKDGDERNLVVKSSDGKVVGLVMGLAGTPTEHGAVAALSNESRQLTLFKKGE